MWSLVSDTAAFPRLWPWLRSFEPAPLERGATTHCAIGAPLPYLVRLRIEVVDLIPERLVVVDVNGDLRGPARLEIGPTPLGSSARLVWDLELCRPLLRRAARVAAPVLRWGHNRVVDRGVEQFRRAALGPVVT